MDHVSKDGQFGYIKDPDQKVWRKVRLTDGVVVGNVATKEIKKLPPKRYGMTGTSQDFVHYPIKHGGVHGWPPGEFKLPLKDIQYMGNSCMHDGTKLVWESEGKQFYCAGYGLIKPKDYAVVLDLAHQLPPWNRKRWDPDVILSGSYPAYLALNKHMLLADGKEVGDSYQAPAAPDTNIVHFHWSDGGALPVGVDFWEDLWSTLPGTPKVPAKILVSCMGSHGRTGTCLAALMMASNDSRIISPAVAILTVRAKHCEMAVENRTQIKYLDVLAKAWGLPQDAKDTYKIPYGKSADALKALQQVAAKED